METERVKPIVIIPARGGSKGVRGKNLALFGHESLIARCIKTCRRCKDIGGVYVSTDSKAIEGEAALHGAKTITRPDCLATDNATSEMAILDAILTLRQRDVTIPEMIVMVQCTAPFMVPDDISGCIELIRDGGADHSFCAAPFSGHVFQPPDTMPGGVRMPRQLDYPKWIEAGSVYAFSSAPFLYGKTRFCGKGAVYAIEEKRCYEIDSTHDLAVCRGIERNGLWV